MEAGPKILENGALRMEKLPRTPAKEMGSGLEELQEGSAPHQTTPRNIQKQLSALVVWLHLYVRGGRADVLSEWRSTALVNLALFLFVWEKFGWLLSLQAFCLNRQFN